MDISRRTDPEILFFGPDEVPLHRPPPFNHAEIHRILQTLWTGRPSMPELEERVGGRASLLARAPKCLVVFPMISVSAGSLSGTLTMLDGMTSLSVRQYILGVLKAHGLNEKEVTKVRSPSLSLF